MKKDKPYKVGFVGTSTYKIIYAQTEKEAKRKFADIENVGVSSYIVIRRKRSGGSSYGY